MCIGFPEFWSSSYRRDLADSMNYFPVHRFKILSILFWKWPCESRPSNNSKELLVITNFMIDGNDWELLKWKLLNDWFSPWWEGKVRKNCWKPTKHHHTQFLPPPAVTLSWLLSGFDEKIAELWRSRLNTLGVLVGVDFNVPSQWKVSMDESAQGTKKGRLTI